MVVGAGQAGLHLALGLRSHGFDVTLVADRTPDEVRGGSALSAQAMFHPALECERELGIGFWEHQAPPVEGVAVRLVASGGTHPPGPVGRLRHPARSVDPRVKLAGWMETFALRGGRLVVHTAGVADLEWFASGADLLVVATGAGGAGRLFAPDPWRAPRPAPRRTLAAVHVHGLRPHPEDGGTALRFTVVPGVGEWFTLPSLTTTGPCDVLGWSALPGGPADVFAGAGHAERLRLALELTRRHLPQEHARAAGAEPADARASVVHHPAPGVRPAVAVLPSGTPVLGVAGAAPLDDPFTGQGAAARCAASCLRSVVEHGDRPFDAEFLRRASERWRRQAEPAGRWTDALLGPAAPWARDLLRAAGEDGRAADRFAAAFADPATLERWFHDPRAAARGAGAAGAHRPVLPVES
ncbi:alanine-phosphoribitol ligase [Streptomyces capparidis]